MRFVDNLRLKGLILAKKCQGLISTKIVVQKQNDAVWVADSDEQNHLGWFTRGRT